MERSRESKRSGSGPRRLRISCPKDPADAEARMDETPLIEKVKKGNLQAFPTSFSATATTLSKRKRNGFQEAHNLSEITISGKDLPQSTRSEECSYEALQAFHSKHRAKKDELVMNIFNIPRRARTSATRVPSLRRHLEPWFTVASSQQPVATSQQRRSPPKILATKEEKIRPAGMKSRLLKDLEVMESAQISDQEVEVAEVLFGLARSMRSVAQSVSIKYEEKCRGLEEEEFTGLQKSSTPFSDEQKSKRQQASLERQETLCMLSAEMVNANAGFCASGRPSSAKEGSQACVAGDKDANHIEQKGEEPKAPGYNLAEQIPTESSLGLSSLSVDKSEMCGQGLGNVGGDCSETSSRRHDAPEGSATSGKQDARCLPHNPLQAMLMPQQCLPHNPVTEEDLKLDNKRLSLSESSSNFVMGDSDGKLLFANNEMVNRGDKAREVPVKEERSFSAKKDVQWNQELSKDTLSSVKEEQMDFRLSDIKKEGTMMPDLCQGQEVFSAGFSLPSTAHPSSINAATSVGWMGPFPHLGFDRTAGLPWFTNCSHLGSSTHQAMQLPYAPNIEHPVQRMRRCATHVYIARFIQQEQQFCHRTFWPSACNPYGLSLLPANLQGKEQWSNKLPALQAEHGHSLAESNGTRLPSSRGIASNKKSEDSLLGSSHSAHAVGAGTFNSFDDSKSVMAHAQFKQNTMQLSGSGTVCMPLNGPAQNPSIFSKSLFTAHASPQNFAQAPSLSQFPKRQQGHHGSLHAGLSSHTHSTQHQAQLQQQVHCEQLKQQQAYLTSSPQLYSARSHAFLEGDWGGGQGLASSEQAQLQLLQSYAN